jgi:hypothetical protein
MRRELRRGELHNASLDVFHIPLGPSMRAEAALGKLMRRHEGTAQPAAVYH